MSFAKLAEVVSETARHYAMLGRTTDAVGLFQATLEFAGPDLAPQHKALLMADLGGVIWKQGQHEHALELLQEAQRLAEAGQDKHSLATALYHLGELAYMRVFMMQEGRDLDEALDYHRQCLALRQEIQDHPGVTLSLSRVGVLYERREEREKALAHYQQAIELAQEVDYPLGVVRPYTHIGGYHRRDGDPETALSFYQKALNVSQEVGCSEDIVFGLCNVGWAAYKQDQDFERALEHFQRALDMAQGMDFKFAIGRAYHVLAELYADAGDDARALEYFKKLARLGAENGYRIFASVSDKRMAEIENSEP